MVREAVLAVEGYTMTWEQLVTAALGGLPIFLWKLIDRQDQRSKANKDKAAAEEAVTKLTAAIESKNNELDVKNEDLDDKDREIERKDREIDRLTARISSLESIIYRGRPPGVPTE